MTNSTHNLYRDSILEHARNPRNAEPVKNPDLRARASNPLCGDELELTLTLEGETIRAVGLQVRGCAIAQASASMMSEVLLGKTVLEVKSLGLSFRQMMEGEQSDLPETLVSLKSLEAVRQHRSRITCTLLAWNAFQTASESL